MDIPDFHSIGISPPFFDAPESITLSLLADRFGRVYIAANLGAGLGGSVIGYTEGYVGRVANWSLDRSLQGPGGVREAIAGWQCGSGNVLFFLGIGVGGCLNRYVTTLYTFGVFIDASLTWVPTLALDSLSNPSYGWDWAIRHRSEGIQMTDLKNIPEVAYNGCNIAHLP